MMLLKVLITLLVVNIRFSDGFFSKQKTNFGEPCAEYDCNTGDLLSCNKDKICECFLSSAIPVYDGEAKPVCRLPAYSFDIGCKETPCKDDQVCNDRRCDCKGTANGTAIMHNDKCFQVEYMEPMESCNIQETANICDFKKFSFCKKSRCVCFSDFFYNSTSMLCERKSDSRLYKDRGYKGMPGEYCLEASDCVEGLTCHSNFTCKCPSSCSYEEERQVCDCGELELETPAAVLWVGCILSFFSIVFWIACIKSRLDMRGEKDNGSVDSPPGTYQASNTFEPELELASQQPWTPSYTSAAAPQTVPIRDDPPSYTEAVKQDTDTPAPFFPVPPPSSNDFSPWTNAGIQPLPTAPSGDLGLGADLHPVKPELGFIGPYPDTTVTGPAYPVTPATATGASDSLPVTHGVAPYHVTPVPDYNSAQNLPEFGASSPPSSTPYPTAAPYPVNLSAPSTEKTNS